MSQGTRSGQIELPEKSVEVFSGEALYRGPMWTRQC